MVNKLRQFRQVPCCPTQHLQAVFKPEVYCRLTCYVCVGDSLSPRRHSFTAPQHPRSSSIVAAVLPSSLSVSGISSSATCSHGGADSTEWLQGVRTSISGGNNMCSDSGRLRSDSGRMRRDSELMAQQASSKAQLVAASELSLQRQTHAALQRLSIKQLTKESEDQPLQHTPHK